MIHLIKRISLLNQQSVCNSPHHILTFSQLTVLSINIIMHDSTVNCENVRIWCGELHTDCWFNKDICLLRWIMVHSSWLLPVMKWIMVNSSWHSCSLRGTLFWRIANALKLCLWWLAVKTNIVNVTKITKIQKIRGSAFPGFRPFRRTPPWKSKKRKICPTWDTSNIKPMAPTLALLQICGHLSRSNIDQHIGPT